MNPALRQCPGSGISDSAILRLIDARLVFAPAYRVQGMEASMRYFRRLPPLLRVLTLVGLVAALAAMAMCISALLLGFPIVVSSAQAPFDGAPLPSPTAQQMAQVSTSLLWRVAIGANLLPLSGACSWPVQVYVIRFRRPAYALPWLVSQLEMWPAQLLAVLALGALPLTALVIALLTPPNVVVVLLAMAASVIASCVLLGANIWAVALSYA